MLRAGSLNSRIKLQRPAETQSDSGAPTQGWADVAELWANVRYLNGTESIKSDAPVSVARASIRIRRRPDVVPNMRVLHGSVIFNVLAVLPNEESRDFVDLACETGANHG